MMVTLNGNVILKGFQNSSHGYNESGFAEHVGVAVPLHFYLGDTILNLGYPDSCFS
jgi:hypothetical protein